jgi:uncharacterized protein YciI
MRLQILLCLLAAGVAASCTFSPREDRIAREGESGDTVVYDSALARTLNADAYGMRTYVMALLKAGPNRSLDSAQAADLLRAHLDNIQRMAQEGDLVLAGPFSDTTDLAGIYVFDVSSMEEARALTETDPAVQAGRFVMELHPWYGPAMLKRIPELNRRVERMRH